MERKKKKPIAAIIDKERNYDKKYLSAVIQNKRSKIKKEKKRLSSKKT